MIVYVVLGYDEDYYTFETFEGVFDTREKAVEYMQNDLWEEEYGRCYQHQEYTIVEYDVINSKEIARYNFVDREGELVAETEV